jgi:trk system potassium uptake protein TrkH
VSERAIKRLPGNRVVRRRIDAQRVIALPEEPGQREVPNTRTHAKRFVLGFTLLVLTGALVLSLPWVSESGKGTPFIDALFTAISASAVTGLVTVDTQNHWNFFGELVVLLLIQAGGLGFMVGASLVLLSLRRGSSLRDTLLLQDGTPTLSLAEVGNLTGRILKFTLVTEAIGAVILTITFSFDHPLQEAIWHGVFHSVSSFCNAGFDLQGGFTSLSGYRTSIPVNFTVMALIQAGSLSYMVLHDAWAERRWNRLALDTKLVLLVNAILLAAGAIGFLIIEWHSALTTTPAWARPMSALFQSVAARTAGPATVDFGQANPATLFLWVALMFVGGAAGSTAGGVKLATIGLVAVAVLSTVRGQPEPQVFGRRISTQLVFRAMAVIALFLFVHFALTLLLALTEDVFNAERFGFLALMFETMSATGTVGVSTGITPHVSTAGKVVLGAAMFFGRLGPLTAVYALQRRQHPTRYRFPEAPVRIG